MPVFEQPVDSDEPTTVEGTPDVASRQRQCGRCRGVFAVVPGIYDEELSDWWVCQPCRAALFPSTGATP